MRAMPSSSERERSCHRGGSGFLPNLLRHTEARAAARRGDHVGGHQLSKGGARGRPGRRRRGTRLVGFTVLTKIGFGLVAVVIGFLVGQGTARFAGGKRSVGLQGLAGVGGALSFLVAAYLGNMTFIKQGLAQKGQAWRGPFPPPRPRLFYPIPG